MAATSPADAGFAEKLFRAVETGRITKFLSANCNENTANLIHNGKSLLDHAVEFNSAEIVELLLAVGADANKIGDSNSPLHRACSASQVEIVKILVNHPSIQINLKPVNGLSPLHLAAGMEEDRSEVIKLLLSHPNISVSEVIDDNTPLMRACTSGMVENVRELIKCKAIIDNINYKNPLGESAMDIAVEEKNKEIVQLLLDTLAIDPNSQDYEGSDTLALKILDWDIEMFKKVLQLYPNVSLLLENCNEVSVLSHSIDQRLDEAFELITNYIKLWGKSQEIREAYVNIIEQEEKNVNDLKEKLEKSKDRRADLQRYSSKLEGVLKRKIRDTSIDENDLMCPITNELMKDPVIASDGNSYERSAIQKWFKSGKRTSPLTNEPLVSQKLFPNHRLKSMIQSHIKNNS